LQNLSTSGLDLDSLNPDKGVGILLNLDPDPGFAESESSLDPDPDPRFIYTRNFFLKKINSKTKKKYQKDKFTLYVP